MDSRQFRDIAGCFATGVTVVTTQDAAGLPAGMTVNSFTSLSLDPPLVLVTIAKTSSLFDTFMQAGGYAVNILRADQEGLSRQFATKNIDRFAQVSYRTGVSGSPVLDGVLAYFDCRVVDRHPAGDHVILIGEVVDGGLNDGHPLLFYRGKYTHIPGAP
ncbi:MAG: flavin reductase family protein [Alicyclobacillus sp.]|nr:flavin reductase family protein [Alicyclobacillus sp.]